MPGTVLKVLDGQDHAALINKPLAPLGSIGASDSSPSPILPSDH